jgi:hypothetical protein
VPALERLHHDPTLSVFALGNVCVGVWRDAPKKGQISALQNAFFSHAGKHKELALANLIVSGTPIFPEEARKEAALLPLDKRGKIRATAHVILVGGFAGAATRAFLSGITLITRTTGHTGVFSQIPPASKWLEERIPKVPGIAWRPGELETALGQAAETPA